MARKISEIQQEALDHLVSIEDVSVLEVLTPAEIAQVNPDSNSRVSMWRKPFYAIAIAINALEVLWEEFERRVLILIAQQRVHSVPWYRDQILRYRHGAITDALGYYYNSNLTPSEIETMKVFKKAAITKTIQSGAIILRGKVAMEDSEGNLVPNTAEHIAAGQAFITDNTDAGTIVNLTTNEGDDLKLEIDIYFDPQILDSNGRRVDGTNDTPVIDATVEFLKSLEFNDRYIKSKHENALEAIEGVTIPNVKLAASKYGIHAYDSVNIPNAGLIDQIRVADAGYFRIDMAELTINYLPDE